MYRVLVQNRTDRKLSLCETTTIAPGMGRIVGASDDILVADRLVAVVGVAVVMDFPEAERGHFVVTATEFGCEIDHPGHGRVSVTIFDPHAQEIGLPEAAPGGAEATAGA
ncbi:MAG: hypothetical protein IAE82_18225 [Opitutaceae bacterium]|nr:hypothetical protein [Opitutaceae bacterium]